MATKIIAAATNFHQFPSVAEAPDMYRSLTQVELELLTGSRVPARQRAVCNLLDVRYTQKRISRPDGRGFRLHDECNVWLDGHVDMLLDGWRDPNVGLLSRRLAAGVTGRAA